LILWKEQRMISTQVTPADGLQPPLTYIVEAVEKVIFRKFAINKIKDL
jgi:hypothetical protein